MLNASKWNARAYEANTSSESAHASSGSVANEDVQELLANLQIMSVVCRALVLSFNGLSKLPDYGA